MRIFVLWIVFSLLHGLNAQVEESAGGTANPIAELINAGESSSGSPTDEKEQSDDPISHVIRSGDNPWTIAKQYGISMEDLVKFNDIKNTKNLQIGQVLKIPPSAAPAPHKPIGEPVSERASPGELETYTIKKGDNPWTVAKRLKIDYQKLIDLNRITDPTDLQIGQKLKIPEKGEKVPRFVNPSAPPQEEVPFEADGHKVYTIQKGDNPWTIAKKLQIDHGELMKLNPSINPKDLKIGQKLKLPKEE